MCLCVSVQVLAEARKKVLDLLELEFQAFGSYLMWVLGTELVSSVKVVCTLNCGGHLYTHTNVGEGCSHCCSDWAESYHIAQADLEFMAILLSQFSKCWDYRHEH